MADRRGRVKAAKKGRWAGRKTGVPVPEPGSNRAMRERACRHWSGHVIVCGLRGIGLRIVEQLHLAGVQVAVVDDEHDLRRVQLVSDWGIPRIVGSARARTPLMEAGLAGAAAVVCVEHGDLHTLETALLVRELRPDVRVVVQLVNSTIAASVSSMTGPGAVLDVASLATPSVVEACLRRTTHPLKLGGVRFVVAELNPPRPGSFRSLYEELAPVAVAPADGSPMVICPGRDQPVAPGDLVAVLGTAEQFAAVGHPLADEPASAASEGPGHHGGRPGLHPVARLRRVRRTVSGLARATDRPLRLALAALGTFMVVSTVVLWIAYRRPGGGRLTALDALYFTVETVATVGFGDFSFSGQEVWLEAFGVLMILGGITLVTSLFALLTNLLVSLRVEQSLGRHRATTMTGHVVLVGLGSVGLGVLRGLRREGQPVVVVEQSDANRYLDQARALGVPVLVADASQRQSLVAANVEKAAAVAVLTSDDLVNLETGLAVRQVLGGRFGQVPVVLRVFDRGLARTVERSFGFRDVRSTSALAAPWFVAAALGLDVLGTFWVQHQAFLAGRLVVRAHGSLGGLTMQELPARTRVVAIGRAGRGGQLEYPPRRSTRLRPADELYLIGPSQELLRLLRSNQRPGGGGPQLPVPG